MIQRVVVSAVYRYSHYDVRALTKLCIGPLVFNISALKAVCSLGSCGSLIFSCIIYARSAFGHYMIRLYTTILTYTLYYSTHVLHVLVRIHTGLIITSIQQSISCMYTQFRAWPPGSAYSSVSSPDSTLSNENGRNL